MDGTWYDRSRTARSILFGGLSGLAAVYFFREGMWTQAWTAVAFAVVNLALLVAPMPGRRQTAPTLDIDKSLRNVGARRTEEAPKEETP
jgi:hypothetical protein